MNDAELFNIDDVTFDFIPRKGKNEILIIMKSKREINLMVFYLALRAYVEGMEAEIGIMAESDGEH